MRTLLINRSDRNIPQPALDLGVPCILSMCGERNNKGQLLYFSLQMPALGMSPS